MKNVYLSYIKKYGGYTGAVTLISALIMWIMPSVEVYVVAKFIDAVVHAGDGGIDRVLSAAILIAVVYFVQYMIKMLNELYTAKLELILSSEFEKNMIIKRNQIKYSVFDNSDNYELISRVCADEEEQNMLWSGYSAMMALIKYIVEIISVVSLIIVKDLFVGILVGAMILFVIPLAYKCGQEDYDAYENANKLRIKAQFFRKYLADREYLCDRYHYQYTEYVNAKWRDNFAHAIECSRQATKRNYMRLKISSAITAVISALVALLMLRTIRSGQITLGIYTSVVGYICGLVHTMSWQMGNIVEEFIRSGEYNKDYIRFERLAVNSNNSSETVRDITSINRIEFKNVTFSYDENKKILDEFSYVFTKNKKYALVGINGAGKSTIVKLILKFYDNYEGQILINDVELRDIPQDILYKHLSVVFQNYAKYEISFREHLNISVKNDDIMDDESVQEILKQVQLDGVINDADSNIGKLWEDNRDLSGGQWQKVAIARALAGKTDVCILDEPTASIDPISEKRLYELFTHLFKNSMNIMISHRLYSTKNADEIVVLSDGKVKESGTYDELIKLNGLYADMYETQRSWYL